MKTNDQGDKPVYRAIEKYGKTEIKKAIDENDADKLLLMVLSVALYSDDNEYAENFCVQFSNHEDINVRANAIQGFGHIARIHRKLDEKNHNANHQKGFERRKRKSSW